MRRKQPRVVARRALGPNLVVGVRAVLDASLVRRMEPVRRALRSEVACGLVRALGEAALTPGDLARATGKSKFAVSQTIHVLKAARLVEGAAGLGGDQRYRHYRVRWERFGDVFRQDHATALELHASASAHAGRASLEGRLGHGELRLLANGRLLSVRRLDVAGGSRGAIPDSARIAAEFTAAFRIFFSKRPAPTLRDRLLSFYEESVRAADELPSSSALAAFMRFQKAAFRREASVHGAYEAALANLPPPVLLSSREAPVLLFVEAGRESPDGEYVLDARAESLVVRGAVVRIDPSYVYDPPGGGSWT